MKAKSGFTLVEILIVVVILGILAAIVIPQFTNASSEAKLSSLCTDLQTLRSQIELYKCQHNDNPPSWLNFVAQMTEKTDVNGNAGNDFGPYLQKVPVNQFIPAATGQDAATGNGTIEAWDGNTATAVTNQASWGYHEASGAIRANSTGHESL